VILGGVKSKDRTEMESHADTGPASVPAGEAEPIGRPGRRGSTVAAGSTYFWANPPGPRGLEPETEPIVIHEPAIEDRVVHEPAIEHRVVEVRVVEDRVVEDPLNSFSAVPVAEVDLLEREPESEPDISGDAGEQSPPDEVAVQASDCDCLSCRFGQPIKTGPSTTPTV
jgi:hypothetical protein